MQLSSNRTRLFGVVFSVLFSLICEMCSIYQTKISVGYSDIGRILINSAFIAIFTFVVYTKFRNATIKISKCVNAEIIIGKDDWKYYLKCAAATFMLLLPVWLAYYPGLNNYDAYSQIKQGIVTGYSQWHPIVHTFWLKFFLYTIGGRVLNSYTAGWAVGMLCQMLIVSFSMSYMHLFLYRISVPKKIRIALVVGIPVMPEISVMSISSTKDVIFGCFFLLTCVCISYWTLNSELCKRTRFIVLYLISLVGTMMFRNNGVYGLIAAFIAGSIYFSLKKSWRFSILTLCGILIGYFGLHGLQAITKSPDVNFNEALSVPYQQLAYVYKVKGDSLDQGTKSEIEFMIPEVEKYRVNYADMIKFSGNALTNEDGFDRFLKLYFRTGLKYPLHYVEAFIQQNMGYLYIWDNTASEIQASGENGWGGYMETEMRDLHGEAGGVLESKSFLPSLKSLYERLFSYNDYKQIIPLFIVCSLGLYFWLIVITSLVGFELKTRSMIILLANIAGFLLTIFLGPMVAVRYAFPYIIVTPVIYFNVVGELAKKRTIEGGL